MEKQYVVGVDVGGQTSKIGVVNARGEILSRLVIRSDTYGTDANAYLSALADAIRECVIECGKTGEIRGVGVGAPNSNYYTGQISCAPNLLWAADGTVEFSKILSENLGGISVSLTNDANAAAIGEMVYGAAKGMKDFIVVTLGTGLGSGFVANGQLIYGHDSFAGELGHVIVNKTASARVCGCGRKGCLETYVSATGIKRTAFKLLADHIEDSEFRNYSFNELTAEMITKAALNGDRLAIEAYEYTGMILGQALADAVTITSPEAIFLFGGLAKAGKYIFEPTKKYMEMHMLSNFRNKVKLLPSGIDGKNAAVLGASALIWQQLENQK